MSNPETSSIQPEKQKLRWDDASLEHNTACYPERVREATIWLGRFGRDKCAKNIDILAQKAAAMGYSWSYGSFHKTLTGKYFDPKAKSTGDADFLLRMVSALMAKEKLEDLAGKVSFIETPTTRKIFDLIDNCRAPARVCKFGVIIGHTGRQKSASFIQYCAIANNPLAPGKDVSSVEKVYRCVHVEAPYRPNMREFTTKLGMCFGLTRSTAMKCGLSTIREQVNANSTIIVDNVQRLYKPLADDDEQSTKQSVFNFLQELQDDTKCTIILSFTRDFYNMTLSAKMKAGYFEQFEGRAGGRDAFLILEDYESDEDILAIARGFGFLHPENHIDRLRPLAHSYGRVRILFNALQNARKLANAMNTELTVDILEESLSDK